MAWKVYIVVYLLHVGCFLAQEISLTQLLIQMIATPQQPSTGDPPPPPSNEALRRYMESFKIRQGEDVKKALLQGYLDKQEAAINHYHLQQAGDLVTKSLLGQIFEEGDDLSEFAVDMVLNQIKASVRPANDEKIVMGMLFEYLVENPESENKEMLLKLLYRLMAKQNMHDRATLRGLVLHEIHESHEEKKEVLKEIFKALMSEEMVPGKMNAQDMYLVLIEHLSNQLDYKFDKRALGMHLMRNLADRMDNQGEAMLRHYITAVILEDLEPTAVPEEEAWKYEAPGPCRIEDQSGNVLRSYDCPDELPCNLGPVRYRFNGRDLGYYMCRYTEEDMEYFAFHACEVIYPNGVVDVRPNCGESSCNLGPFFTVMDDATYQVKYCASYADYTADHSNWEPEVRTACALEEPRSRMRPVQRKCPSEQFCTGKPFEIELEGYPLLAYMCQPDHSTDHHLAMTFMNAMLGYEPDKGKEDRMGGETVGNMTAKYPDSEDFLQFVVLQLWNQMQNPPQMQNRDESMDEGRGMDNMMDRMHQEDPLMFALLKSLMENRAQNYPLVERFLNHMETKKELGIVSDVDRTFARGIIWNILADRLDPSHGGDGGEEDLHSFEHDMILDNLKDLYDLVSEQRGGGDSTGGSNNGGMNGSDMDDQELIKLFLEILQKQNL